MSGVADITLLQGWLPASLLVLGVLGAVVLLIRRDEWWINWGLPLSIVTSALLAGVLDFVVEVVWKPFPEALPLKIVLLSWGLVLGLVLAGAQLRRKGWSRRMLALTASLLVALLCLNQINAAYGEFPTVRALLGLPLPDQAALPPLEVATTSSGQATKPSAATSAGVASTTPATGQSSDQAGTMATSAGTLDSVSPSTGPVSATWTPPAGMPAAGQVSEVEIPGTISGFAARTAWIYLPPAYLTQNRPSLPVLVMIPGQPGSDRDWLDSGGLAAVMDQFATSHGGLAPIVVMADALGGPLANPLCADTSAAKVDTYLSQDLPTWISANLQVLPDHRSWAIGGFSYGGTCSLQMAVNHPDVYSSFVDIAGQAEPTLGTRSDTVDQLFGGNESAFLAINPLTILSTKSFPRTSAFIAAAQDDPLSADAAAVLVACQAAGMKTTTVSVPGGHTWPMATAALTQSLPWLATQVALTA